MTDELRTGMGTVDARVYPGMFADEVQATVKLNEKEVTVLTSKANVVIDDATPSEGGSKGKLKVYLVDVSAEGLLIDLPGEALGTTKRLRVDGSSITRID